jgi:hypothetical protein
MSPVLDRLMAKVSPCPITGCWWWTGSYQKSGYGQFNPSGTPMAAHRAMWITVNGNPGPLFVCHRCDNRACVNPSHLYAGAPSENTRDMMVRGRMRGGPRRGPVLSRGDVLAAREMRAAGLTSRLIAQALGVSESCANRAASGGTWRHV